MNWFSVIIYSTVLFFSQTAASTVTALLVGVDNIEPFAAIKVFAFSYLPSVLAGLLVLSFYAKVQLNKTLLHLTVVGLTSALLGFMAVSLVVKEVYLPPTWFIDLPISVATILVANYIGISLRAKPNRAT